MKVLAIIPCYNEEKSLIHTVENLKIKAPDIDFIIINDCSKDNTYKLCIENHYPVLNLSVNLGIGGCMQAGYLYALEKKYDIAIQHDGDGQHDPLYLKNVIFPIESGIADIVIGSRFLESNGFQSTVLRRFGIFFLSTLIYLCTGVKIKDVTSGYRAVNRKYIELYSRQYAQDYPEPEAIMDAALTNAKIIEVPVIMHERKEGKSSINASKSILYMIKVSFAILLHRAIASKGN